MNKSDKEIWVFLSHSNADYEKVRRIRNMLEDLDMRPIMFFLKCLNDEDEIDDLIKREIDCRTRFILCNSENAKKSRWVQKEIEYIRSKQKPYEIIDLNKSDEEIKFQLKEVQRKTKIFISCSPKDRALASAIYKRLSKYDYNLFWDLFDIKAGISYIDQLVDNLASASKEGYVISLLTSHGLQSDHVNLEFNMAHEYDRKHNNGYQSLIPIVIGEKVPEMCKGLKYIQLSSYSDDLPNRVVDSILKFIHTPGEILTYYRNFKNGINNQVDLTEADRLGKLFYKYAKEMDDVNSPTGQICLGICYEEGIGVEQDLYKAYLMFNDPIATDGLARDMAKRVHRKLYPEKYM